MTQGEQVVQWMLGIVLILSSLGVVLFRKPVHSSLAFLLTLLTLATLYLQLSAQFIAVMQVLVYGGAILVLFMFVIVLFQDAYQQISQVEGQSMPLFLFSSAAAFILALIFFGWKFAGLSQSVKNLPEGYGSAEALGKALYVDFFFPFEAVTLLFLIAAIGTLYIAKKVI